MKTRDDQFLRKLLAAFKIEAEEHLKAITRGLLELERSTTEGGETADTVETVCREAHSLKGASRSVSHTEIEAVCQAVESVLVALKSDRVRQSAEMFDVMHGAVDVMTGLLTDPETVDAQSCIPRLLRLLEQGAEDSTGPAKPTSQVSPPQAAPSPVCDTESEGSASHVAHEMGVAECACAESTDEHGSLVGSEAKMDTIKSEPGTRFEPSLQADTVRIAVDKLDPLLRQVEEMVSVKLTTTQRVSDLNGLSSGISHWKKKWAGISSQDNGFGKILIGKDKAGSLNITHAQLSKLIDFLTWNETFVKTMDEQLKSLARAADSDARLHGSMVDDLLDDMMNVLMLPCSSLVEVLPKLVRDLSRDAGKDVYLQIRGGELEIDRRILEEMKDPLIHLIRNSIDHGIELPDTREQAGKPRRGTITIAFSQISGNQVELAVSDDGAGIDAAKVRKAAAGTAALAVSDSAGIGGEDALSLVFRSGVSTSSTVTSISGRGLGLAIVREKVENLGGNVSVATAPQTGTTFRILLPVTLSTFRGILVQAYEKPFIVPTANVERVARIRKDSVKTVGNRDTVEFNGKTMPLVRLGDALELPRVAGTNGHSELIPALILRSGETLVSFSVDSIVQEQEVLVKPLGKQLSRVRNVGGATMLGSGELVPILNVQDLVKSATKRAIAQMETTAPIEQFKDTTSNILVVEDSITSRMLLKNILESQGYNVTTTVDGTDAWAALKSNRFDLVLSDVQMPRMDGFQLTENIRQDEDLGQVPVVLVTSLGSREDRERGIEVGANAYITKGDFDQNNLLEVIERLV